jgi:hypothetical protein
MVGEGEIGEMQRYFCTCADLLGKDTRLYLWLQPGQKVILRVDEICQRPLTGGIEGGKDAAMLKYDEVCK